MFFLVVFGGLGRCLEPKEANREEIGMVVWNGDLVQGGFVSKKTPEFGCTLRPLDP